jgi:uncharacterized protein
MAISPEAMDPIAVIDRFYPAGGVARAILLAHSRKVAEKARAVAARVPQLCPDLAFIEQAAMLHDIGMLCTDTPSIGCTGKLPYICHGIEGRKLLEAIGLFRHAKVCERHVGVGLTAEDIRGQNLPLPQRDMVPVSLEEKIICFADKFFSKEANGAEKTVEAVLAGLSRFGPAPARRFTDWLALFGA